jgi:HEAT repeat protein
LATLRLRATDPHISFSGTSLLGLYRLRDTAGLEPSELIERATYILNEPSLATSNQVTALQLAALLGDPDALGLARSLAVDTSISIQLRISAVASIGQRGTLADLRLIQPLVASPDLRLRNAARFAIKRLESAPTVETL